MTKKKFEEIINDAIADLNSCIKDQERREKESFLTGAPISYIHGKIDGYKESIEMLEFMKKVWAK